MRVPSTLPREDWMEGTARIGELRREGEQRLRDAGVANAAQETLWLLESLGVPRVALFTSLERMMNGETVVRARELFARRARHEPLQYILGTQDFCGRAFEVGPAVLIPRPETELLVEETVRLSRGRGPVTVIDVGTGSGCLAVSVAKAIPGSRVWAIDVSDSALEVARRNIRRHGVDDSVTLLRGDLFDPLEAWALAGRADVILSNPPYIAESDWAALPPDVALYEPRTALDGGPDGLRVHRRLVESAPRWLTPGGWLVLEIGQDQQQALMDCVRASGQYQTVVVRKDERGLDRVVGAQSRL